MARCRSTVHKCCWAAAALALELLLLLLLAVLLLMLLLLLLLMLLLLLLHVALVGASHWTAVRAMWAAANIVNKHPGAQLIPPHTHTDCRSCCLLVSAAQRSQRLN